MLPALRGRDLVLEGGRDQDVALDLEDLGVADVLGAREALDRAVLLLPGDDPGDVEAGRVVDAAGRVGDRDDRRALVDDQASRRSTPALPKPWTATVHFVRSMPRWRAASTMR